MKALGLAFARYLAAGLLATLVGLSVIWGSMWSTDLHPLAANALGYAVALLVSFQINRLWTFAGALQGPAHARLLRYALAFAAAYGANLATLACMLQLSPGHGYYAQLPAMAAYTVSFFLLNRFWVFSQERG